MIQQPRQADIWLEQIFGSALQSKGIKLNGLSFLRRNDVQRVRMRRWWKPTDCLHSRCNGTDRWHRVPLDMSGCCFPSSWSLADFFQYGLGRMKKRQNSGTVKTTPRNMLLCHRSCFLAGSYCIFRTSQQTCEGFAWHPPPRR